MSTAADGLHWREQKRFDRVTVCNIEVDYIVIERPPVAARRVAHKEAINPFS